MARIIDIESFSEMGFLLFLSSLGLGVTRLVMNFFQGKPEAGIHFFAYQISSLLNLFGQKSEVVSGAILFQGKKITCDLVKLGFYPWLAFTLTLLVVIVFVKGSFKKKISVLLIAFLFIMVIYCSGFHLFLSFFRRSCWRALALSISFIGESPLFPLCR